MVKLKSYDDIMTLVHLNYLLLVVLLKNGLEIFVGVPSERYPAHLESRFYLANIVRNSIYKVKLIMQLMKLGTILNQVCS